MKIACPQCGFCREVSPDRISADSVIATCPKCACRFRFSRKNGVVDILPPKGWKRMDKEESEEDIRQLASEAYEREARRFRNEEAPREAFQKREIAPQTDENPWETASGAWFGAFYQTVLRVMFSAPHFFRNLKHEVPQGRAIVFYLIICVFQTITERFWGDFFRSYLQEYAASDPQLEQLLAMLTPHTNLALNVLLRSGLLLLQLYIFSFLMYLVYRMLAPAKASFGLVLRIMVYSSAPALLCIVPVLGSMAGMIWGLACLAVGCKTVFDLDWPKTLVGFVPLLLVFAPILPQIMAILRQ